jgi:drug/metabolite transporter (DMT)-like permease
MVLALVAIVAASYKPRKVSLSTSSAINYLLPLSIFIFGGIIDSTINYVSFRFLTPQEERVFPIIIFGAAAFTGFIILAFRRQPLSRVSVVGGILLGIVNYFSLYYLVRALSAYDHDGALVYPLINVGIILVTAGVSAAFFQERLSLLNKGGILLAILSIILLSYQEILQYL